MNDLTKIIVAAVVGGVVSLVCTGVGALVGFLFRRVGRLVKDVDAAHVAIREMKKGLK